MAVFGSGSSTRLALGYGNSPAVTGNNGYTIIDPTAGTATAVAFAGSPPAAGDFRLGITFANSTRVIGTQGSSVYRDTSFSGTTGTLLSNGTLTSSAERLLAYAVVGGVPLLAAQSNGDSHVSIYDVTDLANPIFLTSGNATTGTLTANGNGTGELAWGDISGDTALLWAMSSNQGIQAFTVVVPEPSVIAMFLTGAGVLGVSMLRRRKS